MPFSAVKSFKVLLHEEAQTKRRHDTQYNDTQHDHIQHNNE